METEVLYGFGKNRDVVHEKQWRSEMEELDQAFKYNNFVKRQSREKLYYGCWPPFNFSPRITELL